MTPAEELTKRLADVLHDVPHHETCLRATLADQRCTCEVGGRLLVMMKELGRLLAPRLETNREQFVERVVDILESSPESLGREMGEALVGMGVSLLGQLGVDPKDVAESIIDRRNAS